MTSIPIPAPTPAFAERYVCAANKRRDDLSSTANSHGAVKPYDRPVVGRFVPPNFNKDAWLAEYRKRPGPRPNAAPRLASNPFTYPIAMLGNVIRSARGTDARAMVVIDPATEKGTSREGVGLGSALFDMWSRVKGQGTIELMTVMVLNLKNR